MKKLASILPDHFDYKVFGEEGIKINGIQLDSRKVEKNDVFVAIDGFETDGHRFIDSAIANGAKCIVLEKMPESVGDDIVFIKTKNSRKLLAEMVNIYYDRPSEKLKLIGVTGTNGKTSVVTILYKLMKQLGQKVGLISTIENRINDRIVETERSTPDALSLTRLLSQMVDAGCEYAFMEVTSHAIHQERVAGVRFEGGVFTNITHDHLDYHKTFKEYIRVKQMFFNGLSKASFALVNVDDKNGEVMIEKCSARKSRYSLRTLVDYKAKVISNDLEGLHLDINGNRMMARLTGVFNAYNLLAAFGVADLMGFEEEEIMHALSSVKPAEGRFELIKGREGRIGIVDYAHTPDALEKVLTTIRDMDRQRRMIVVVGCGGDRDKAKRPLMGKLAARYAEIAVYTSDNPRSEEPDQILSEMYTALTEEEKEKVIEIEDRSQAIKAAVKLSRAGDIILVAGKGHEKYQEIKGEKVPFDDKEKLRALLS